MGQTEERGCPLSRPVLSYAEYWTPSSVSLRQGPQWVTLCRHVSPPLPLSFKLVTSTITPTFRAQPHSSPFLRRRAERSTTLPRQPIPCPVPSPAPATLTPTSRPPFVLQASLFVDALSSERGRHRRAVLGILAKLPAKSLSNRGPDIIRQWMATESQTCHYCDQYESGSSDEERSLSPSEHSSEDD